MDALDGKQARRTQTSSPLGELFDHGCDAVTTVLAALTVGTAIQAGPTILMFSLIMSCLVPFFLKQLEEYHTGEMILGYVNVTEAQFITISTYLITAFYGPEFWFRTIEIFGFGIEYRILALCFGWFGALFTSIQSIFALNTYHSSPKSVKHHEYQKQLTFGRALQQAVPVAFGVVMCSIWAYRSHDMMTIYAHYFYLAFGFTVAGIVGKLVIARVCEQDFSEFQFLLLPLILGVVNTFIHVVSEKLLIQIYCILAIGGYLHLALSIIHDFCNHLKIRCLQIPYKKSTK